MRHLQRALVVVFALVAVAGGQEHRPHFTEVFTPEEFAGRRARVMEAIGPNAVAVLKGNEGMPGYVAFRQDSNFFYLTGVEAPGALLLLDGGARQATLFLPPRNEPRERFEGPLLAPGDTARELTGLNAVDAGAFTESLQRLAGRRETLYTPMAPQELEAMSRDLAVRYNLERVNDPWDGRASREAHFVLLLRQRFPGLAVKDLSPLLDRMRLVKSAQEIAVLRKSAELAALALAEAMRSTQPGQYEYELDALARFIYFRNGAQGLAYFALVASARNAYIPHYHEGRRQMQDGDLVLMDFAPDYHYYMSDVTRMWPVNGRFSPEQRELYGFYLKCYQSILRHIRPGVPTKTIMAEAAADMDAVLRQASFSREKYHRAAEKFVADYRSNAETGRLGHWVGMTTHDVGPPMEVLQSGMVFTIEPALRLPEDEIYIRLEDALLVTGTGVENLSRQAPVEMEAIEALMKEPGILKRHPRRLPHDAVRPKPAGAAAPRQ